jgi:S1-C subfamily serine protease
MTHQIVECPGCLTKLRVREAATTITLQCPRCGEQLAVDPPDAAPVAPANKPAPAASKPAPTKSVTGKPAAPPAASAASKPNTSASASKPAPASSRPSQKPAQKPAKKERPVDDDPWNTDSSYTDPAYDDYGNYGQSSAPQRRTPPKKSGNGLMIGLLAGGGVALVGVIIFAVSSFLKSSGATSDTTTGTEIAGTSTGAENAAVAGSDPTGTGVTPPTIPGITLPGQTGTPTPPVGGNIPPATAAISGDARKLRYHWKPGAIHTYMFTVEKGSGDDVKKTTGTCTYNVSGNSNQVVTEEESSGTGFVVAADGLVGTCAHVVEGAKRIEVHLGGQTYPATVVAVDTRSDVALIKINGSGLPTLTLSDSDTVQLAEAVRAIGYPLSDVLGVDVKVTTGTVAGVIQNKERGKQIQIDAAINPGNSGGPVVNGSGQVVGVASAKLSGSSVTSVGFAAPVNQLRALAATKGIQLANAPRGQDLAGPEVARRVTPGVAFIKVWGNSGGKMYEVTFNANFHEQPQMRRSRGGFPGPPSFGSSSIDHGKLTVNALGEVLEFQGEEQLPAVLGPVGVFFMEQLDAYSESQWHVETESTLQRIKRDDSPFGGMPRFGGRMRGFGPPGMFGGQQDQVVEEIPAIERVSYQVGQTLNNKISITKSYEYTATRANNQPYMNIRGTGTLVFDTVQGMPFSLEYNSTVEQNNEDGNIKVPVRVSYTLRDQAEVQREIEQAQQKMAADKKQREDEQNNPNPKLVDDLIAEIRKAEGGNGASQPLSRLSQIAIVEDKRDEVLKIARNHMKNSNGFVKKGATEAFCRWATAEHSEELKKVLADSDGLMHDAKKVAVKTLAKNAKPEDYPTLIMSMTDHVVRGDLKEALISIGAPIEEPVMKSFPQITDASARNDLLEVLKKVGTEKCVDFLEKLATSNDFSVKNNAQQALDAVRARL